MSEWVSEWVTGIYSLKINDNVVNLCEAPMNHTDKKGNRNSKVLEITEDWGLRNRSWLANAGDALGEATV